MYWFIQQGWRNIWRQKIILLFSALPVFLAPIFRTYNKGEQNLGVLSFYLVMLILNIILSVMSFIGVPYLAYSFSMGRSVTIQETLRTVRKFAVRIVGCFSLIVLISLPCFFLAFAVAMQNSPPVQALNTAILVFMPLSIFSSLWSFSVFGLFEKDWGIRKSIENAWRLFTSHFATLAILGICLALTFQLLSTMTGILTVLIRSGFDATSLSGLNLVNPSMTLGKDILFLLINGGKQAIYYSFSASVFALAYLKYSGVKNTFGA